MSAPEGPRIVAGAWRGRRLAAPPGTGTRPTSIRARQAAFDMLAHAPWAADALRDARVLDAFAGTGAYGLEALSRGAARATFIETDRIARGVLAANIRACGADDLARVVAADAYRPPAGQPHTLVFLDPPYGAGAVARAAAALSGAGWFAPGALIAAELGPQDEPPAAPLAARAHGRARLVFWRA